MKKIIEPLDGGYLKLLIWKSITDLPNIGLQDWLMTSKHTEPDLQVMKRTEQNE